MIKEKNGNSINKIIPTEPIFTKNNYERNKNKYPYGESFTPNKKEYNYNRNISLSNYPNNSINMKKSLINGNNIINELNLGNKMNISNSYKNLPNINNLNILNNENDNNNNDYLPRIANFKGNTDITDHSYYDKISKQLILQMNKNYVDYNKNLAIKRYNSNEENNLYFLRKNKLAAPPQYISNPKYYDLGESKLRSNPIVNPGNRAPIFNYYNNHNHRIKSEFI